MQKRSEPEDRGPELVAVSLSFLVLSWVTVCARCWVRVRMIKAFAIDDWLTVLTLQLFTIYCALVLVGVHWGCGRHMHDLKVKQRVNAMHAWYYGELFYILTTTLLRFAIGAFLLRVATKKPIRRIIYACFAANIAFNIYFFVFTIFQCHPIQGFWTRLEGAKGVVCHPKIAVDSTYASSVLSATIDWIFGLLPIWIIQNLKINTRRRIALGAIMGIGAIASIAPIVRIPYTVSLSHSEDFLWSTVDVSIWSSVEPGIGLIAISLAALRPLFASILAGLTSTGGTNSRRISKPPGSKRRGSKQYGNLSSPQSGSSIRHDKSTDRTWAEEEEDVFQLHSIPPPMGHSVSIEGGGAAAKQGSARLQKSPSTSSVRSPKRSMSGRNSSEEAFVDKHRITMKQDFKHWSENREIFFVDKH